MCNYCCIASELCGTQTLFHVNLHCNMLSLYIAPSQFASLAWLFCSSLLPPLFHFCSGCTYYFTASCGQSLPVHVCHLIRYTWCCCLHLAFGFVCVLHSYMCLLYILAVVHWLSSHHCIIRSPVQVAVIPLAFWFLCTWSSELLVVVLTLLKFCSYLVWGVLASQTSCIITIEAVVLIFESSLSPHHWGYTLVCCIYVLR